MVARDLPENFVHGWVGFVPRVVEGEQSPAAGGGILYEEPLPCLFAVGDAPHGAPAVNSGLFDRCGRSFRLFGFRGAPACRVGSTLETKLIAQPNFVAIDATTPCPCRRQ